MNKFKKMLGIVAISIGLSFGVVSTAWAQDRDVVTQEETDEGFDWGWLGLLGLIGLAGLSGRKRDDTTVVRPDATRRNP